MGQWNYFISAPVFSTLVGGIQTGSFTDKNFDQQTMIDAACSRVSDTVNQDYYALSWQVISQMTLNGEVAKAGTTHQAPQSTPTQSPTVPHPNPTSQAPQPIPTAAPQAPTTCSSGKAKLSFTMQTDDFGLEIHFKVQRRNNGGKFRKVVLIGKDFMSNTLVTQETCIEKNQCYRFRIKDKGENGICCAHGNGWYKVTHDGNILKESVFKNKKTERIIFGDC